MSSENLRDLHTFVTVAEEGSFTRAAARLGLSQSAVSQTVRNLEERVGIRLLNRTTRSVSPTEAGERLLTRIAPALEEIGQGFAGLGDLMARPSGTLRLTADEYAVESVLWPALKPFLRAYPEIHVELTTDYGRTDIIRERQDAGVRRGGLVSRDMIALRIGPDIPMAAVAAPGLLAGRKAPDRPQDLADHPCINLRLPTHGEVFSWTFAKAGKEQRVTTHGPLIVTTLPQVREACLEGIGFAWMPRAYVAGQLESGALVEVLAGWRKTFEGYYLYYPSRRQQPPALAALIETLRWRG